MRDPETKYQELLARLPESSKGEGGAPWDGSAGSDSDIFPQFYSLQDVEVDRRGTSILLGSWCWHG